MKALNVSEARSRLPALIEAVNATRAPIVFLRYGKPAAMLVPVAAQNPTLSPYPLRILPLTMADDFDTPLSGLWEACNVAEAAGRYDRAEKPARAKRGRRRA